MDWCNLQSNLITELKTIYHIPNGGARPAHYRFNHATGKPQRVSVEGGKLKRMGVKPGVWDYHLPIPRQWEGTWYAGAWLEFKSKDGELSPEQREFAAAMGQNRHLMFVFKDWLDAKQFVVNYLGMPQGAENVGRTN